MDLYHDVAVTGGEVFVARPLAKSTQGPPQDARRGKNGSRAIVGMSRQSVFGRLTGYEDVFGRMLIPKGYISNGPGSSTTREGAPTISKAPLVRFAVDQPTPSCIPSSHSPSHSR